MLARQTCPFTRESNDERQQWQDRQLRHHGSPDEAHLRERAVPLAELGGSLADVVEETLFVIDVPAAFAASGKVRPAVYGQPVPQVASNLIGVPALAFPEQLIEIAFRAEVQS